MSKKKILLILGIVLFVAAIIGLVGLAWWLEKKDERQIEKLAQGQEQGQKLIDQYKEAKKTLQKDPNDFGAYFEIGWVKTELKDWPGAAAAYEKSVALNDKNITGWNNLAYVYTQMKNYPKAEESYLKSLEVSAGYMPTYMSLIDFYENYYIEKKSEIEKVILRGLQASPENEGLLSALAIYYRDIGQKGKAIDAYERLLHIKPGDEEIRQEILKLGTR